MSIPSGYTALDFVGFTDKDTYAAATNYVRNDLVHYGGNIWKCLIDNTIGITPAEGANWTLWVGAPASLAERTIAPLENNPADVAYGVGRQIIYDDWMWEVVRPIAVGDTLIDVATDPTNGNIKKSDPVETQLLKVKAEADAMTGIIAPNEQAATMSQGYSAGEQFIRNNILYRAKTNISSGTAWSSLVLGTDYEVVTYTLVEQIAGKANTNDLGTAAAKNSTNAVTQDSTDLVESGAVYDEIDSLNEALANQVGDLTDLDTTVKTDLVSAINECVVEIKESGIVKVTTPSFSSLPQTFTAIGIDGDHELAVDGFALVSPSSAMGNDWNITTAVDSGTGNGQITISGTFVGSTACTVKMSLTKPVKAITAS